MRVGARSVTRTSFGVAVAVIATVGLASSTALAAFPGRNGRIAYSSGCPGDPNSSCVFTVKPNGRDPRVVAEGFTPAFAPASVGRVVVADFDEASLDEVLKTVALKGTDPRMLLTNSSLFYAREGLAFSPSGRGLAYVDANEFGSLRIIRVGDPQRSTSLRQSRRLLDPAWSKRGGLAFTEVVQEENYDYCANRLVDPQLTDVFSSAADGSAGRRVTRLYGASDPNWSPDGRKLVFVRDLSRSRKDLAKSPARATECRRRDPQAHSTGARAAASDGFALYIARASGSGRKRVLGPSRVKLDALASPVWSPDGKSIAFTTAKRKIDVMRLDTGRIRQIATAAYELDWQALPRR